MAFAWHDIIEIYSLLFIVSFSGVSAEKDQAWWQLTNVMKTKFSWWQKEEDAWLSLFLYTEAAVYAFV